MSISGLQKGVKILSWNNDSMILDPKYHVEHDGKLNMPWQASLMPKMGLKEAKNGFSCYITVNIIVWGVDSGLQKGVKIWLWNNDSMILDPKYHAEHDGKLNNARRVFVNAENGLQRSQKWLYHSEYHSVRCRFRVSRKWSKYDHGTMTACF